MAPKKIDLPVFGEGLEDHEKAIESVSIALPNKENNFKTMRVFCKNPK
jgi:hypothetical protein